MNKKILVWTDDGLIYRDKLYCKCETSTFNITAGGSPNRRVFTIGDIEVMFTNVYDPIYLQGYRWDKLFVIGNIHVPYPIKTQLKTCDISSLMPGDRAVDLIYDYLFEELTTVKSIIKHCCSGLETIKFDLKGEYKFPDIKDVIFNNPATIVFWADGSKTVVKCQDDDIYDPEKGLAMAISKKALGNRREYYHTFIHYLKKHERDEFKFESLDTVSLADAAKNFRKFAERLKGKRKRNPVQKAYDILVGWRDGNVPVSKEIQENMPVIDELIGYLGEALEG